MYDDPRKLIRTAALSLFGERGFEATSVSDIAKAAGVPKANVLYYYPNKDILWKEAVDALWNEVNTFFAEHLPREMDVSEQGLASFIELFLTVCRMFPAYIMIPVLEGNADNWRSHWLSEHFIKPHAAFSSSYCNQLIDAGVLPEIDPIIIQNIIAGGGQLLVGWERLWRMVLDDELEEFDFSKRYVEGVLTLVRNQRKMD